MILTCKPPDRGCATNIGLPRRILDIEVMLNWNCRGLDPAPTRPLVKRVQPVCHRFNWPFQQSKGNRIPRGYVTCIVGMQMVSTVVNGEQSRWVVRVAQNQVKIEDIIEFTAAAYPVVDPLTDDFFLGTMKRDWRRSV